MDTSLADAFGARTTPHVYTCSTAEFRLVYRGSIDDNVNAARMRSRRPYLQDAIDRNGGRQEGQACCDQGHWLFHQAGELIPFLIS